MAALAKLVVIGFIVLTIIYVGLSLYSRSVRVVALSRCRARSTPAHGRTTPAS